MGTLRASVLLVLAVGCGRIGFDSQSVSGELDADLGEVDASLGEVDASLGQVDAAVIVADANLLPAAASFSDDFANGTINPEWEVSTTAGCTLVENSNRIRIVSDGSVASRCVMTTSSFYNLNGSSVVVAYPPIIMFLPQLTVSLSVANSADDRVQFAFSNGNFTMSVTQSGLPTSSGTLAYDNSVEYWRIREAGGELFLESSTDFSIWSVVFTIPTPFAVGAVQTTFGAETSGPMDNSNLILSNGYNSAL
jgi:hypothetical protein